MMTQTAQGNGACPGRTVAVLGWQNKISQSEVGWVIRSTGQPEDGQTRKNRLTLRGAVGVWHCESSDRIEGCDGACIHAAGSLAGAGSWSITNVAAFLVCQGPFVWGAFRYAELTSIRVRFGFRILESPNKVSLQAHHLRESQRDPFK